METVVKPVALNGPMLPSAAFRDDGLVQSVLDKMMIGGAKIQNVSVPHSGKPKTMGKAYFEELVWSELGDFDYYPHSIPGRSLQTADGRRGEET